MLLCLAKDGKVTGLKTSRGKTTVERKKKKKEKREKTREKSKKRMGFFSNIFGGLKNVVSKGAGILGNLFSKGSNVVRNAIGKGKEIASTAGDYFNKGVNFLNNASSFMGNNNIPGAGMVGKIGQTLGEYKSDLSKGLKELQGGAHYGANALGNFGNTMANYGKTLDFSTLDQNALKNVNNLIGAGGKVLDAVKQTGGDLIRTTKNFFT